MSGTELITVLSSLPIGCDGTDRQSVSICNAFLFFFVYVDIGLTLLHSPSTSSPICVDEGTPQYLFPRVFQALSVLSQINFPFHMAT